MNLSRAYTLAFEEDLSVGRVQTPTLAMLVERELAIRSFVPEDYLEVVATFRPAADPTANTYTRHVVPAPGRPTRPDKESLQKSMRLPADGEEAHQIVERARTGQAAIESVEVRNAADGAAAALRSDRAAAPRQPAVWLQRAEDARPRAGTLRTTQADQLPAHRQPAPVAGCSARRCRGSSGRSSGRTANTWHRARESGRWAGGSSTMRRSPITTRSSRPPRRPSAPACPPTSGRSTTWSAGACSAPGTRTTSGP